MKKETKEVGRELCTSKEVPSQEGNLRREVSKHQETLAAQSVASLGSTAGNITGRKNK